MLTLLQARTSSSRLPAKVLRPLLGVPMISRQIERIRRASKIGRLVLVTSTDPSDDQLAALCAEQGVDCHRGSLNDVLDRFYQAASRFGATNIVRLTGDCPLTDPDVIDQTIDAFLQGGYDYLSNALHPSFPDGLDVEVCRFETLATAWREAALPSQREHVMPFIYQHPERFRIGYYRHTQDLSHLRWTVDQLADFAFVEAVYERLYPAKPDFGMQDVLTLLENEPGLLDLNRQIPRNEGFVLSQAQDEAAAPSNEDRP